MSELTGNPVIDAALARAQPDADAMERIRTELHRSMTEAVERFGERIMQALVTGAQLRTMNEYCAKRLGVQRD